MKLGTAAATAAALGLAAVPLLTFRADAGPVAASKVAVFADPDYTHPDEEVANLIDDLVAGGHTTVTIDDTSADDFAAGLDGAQVLAFPEFAVAEEAWTAEDFVADLDGDAADLIASFVDGGGRVLFFGSSDPTPAINDLFGFSVTHVEEFCGEAAEPLREAGNDDVSAAAADQTCPITPAAADTEFADGPAAVGYVSDATGLAPGSLPAGSTTAYSGVATTPPLEYVAPSAAIALDAVVSMPYGDGAVVFLGWDWFPDSDEGGASVASVEDEADWATVLDLAVSQPTVTAAKSGTSVVLTSDSPSTQPVFVSLTLNGATQTVIIAPKTTSASVPLPAGTTSASFSVPGWGVGEGAVDVLGTSAPRPVVANPRFTG